MDGVDSVQVREGAPDYVQLVRDNENWQRFLNEVENEVEDTTPMVIDDFAPSPTYLEDASVDDLLSRIDATLTTEHDDFGEVIAARVYLTEEQNITLFGSVTPQGAPRVGDLVSVRTHEGLFDVSDLAERAVLRSVESGRIVHVDVEDLAIEKRSADAVTPGEAQVLSLDGNVRMVRSTYGLTRGHTYTMFLQPVEMVDGYPQKVDKPRLVTGELNDLSPFATMDAMAGRLVIELKAPTGELMTGALPAPVGLDPTLNMFVVEVLPDREMALRDIPLSGLRPGDVIVNPVQDAAGHTIVPMGAYMTVNASHNKHFEFLDSDMQPDRKLLQSAQISPTGFMQGREITNEQFYRTGTNLADGTVADLRVGDRVSTLALQGVGSEDSFVVISAIQPEGKTREVRFQSAEDYGAPIESVRLAATAPMPVEARREGALSEHELRMVRHRVRMGDSALLTPGMQNVVVRGTTTADGPERTVAGAVVEVDGRGERLSILERGRTEPVQVEITDRRALRYHGDIADVPDKSGGMASQFMHTYMRHKNAPPRRSHVEAAPAVVAPSNVIPLRIA